MRKSMLLTGAAALFMTLLIGLGEARAQAAYPSPQAAADALHEALALSDRAALQRVLGAQFARYVPHEHPVDREEVYAFLEAWARGHSIAQTSATRAQMVVGDSDWRFPAPIVRTARGWQFDLRAGQAEMQRRRIGRNELGAIDTLRTLCEAQQRYAQTAGQGRAAQRLVSRPGRHDGLYWPAPEDEPSPLGAEALVMGPETPADAAFSGYRFRVLPGDGCGFAAWPARYGQDGVHSFVIGADGVVRERDLGRSGASVAARLGAASSLDGWDSVR